MTQTRPNDWKNYDDFAAGIATNRLPTSEALVGQTLRICLPELTLTLMPQSRHEVHWEERSDRGGQGVDWHEAIEVAEDTFFIDMTQHARPTEALTFIVNRRTMRVLAIRCRVRTAEEAQGDMRSTGKFLGITGDGAIANSPAGAFIAKASMTFYPQGTAPL